MIPEAKDDEQDEDPEITRARERLREEFAKELQGDEGRFLELMQGIADGEVTIGKQ